MLTNGFSCPFLRPLCCYTFRAHLLQFEFSKNNQGDVALVYKLIEDHDVYLSILFQDFNSGLPSLLSGFNIRPTDVKDYFREVFEELGVEIILDAILYRKAGMLCDHVPLVKYANQLDLEAVNAGKTLLNMNNQKELLSRMLGLWGQDEDCIRACLTEYARPNFSLSLSFNTASNQSPDSKKKEMRDITKLSMGQKVVAALTFILSYSDSVEDLTPLIIDQPEDNLDSQYIYQTLVQKLRQVKRKRQVIIATHNSTLVTNSKAEQVVVLRSDNNHAWIEKSGYPTNRKIAHEILQYLEGGRKSFKHRFFVYREHLKD